MPRYEYKCSAEGCDKIFQVFHSMDEKYESCDQCTEECEKAAPVTKLLYANKRHNFDYKSRDKKVGSIVKSSIEEIKKDIAEEKRRLKEKIYD